MKGNVMKQALHHDCALRGAITLLILGLFLCAWAADTRAEGGLFDLLTPSRDNTKLCSSTPTKCAEKSAEDLRYERILEALKKMEGGERVYSEMATPANEPASYGPSQMVIEKIIEGLRKNKTDKNGKPMKDKDGKTLYVGGESFTFTAEDGKSYTLTQKDLTDAKNRGRAMMASGADLLDEAAKYNDYKDLTMPARTKTADGFLDKSGIPSGEWDKWWTRAVAYQKLIKFVDELGNEYDKPATVVKDAKGNKMTTHTGTGKDRVRVPDTFYTFVDQKGNLADTNPAVTYGKRLDELLALAFPHVTGNRRVAFRPYVRTKNWAEGFYSFYNRAAYSHPSIPYEAFKEGIVKWFNATPEAEESFIRDNIKAAAKHPDVNKDVKILNPDADEEKIARYFASKHNSGGFKAINGAYATKFVEHWKKIKWNFKCGKDPRDKSTSEPEPKEAQV